MFAHPGTENSLGSEGGETRFGYVNEGEGIDADIPAADENALEKLTLRSHISHQDVVLIEISVVLREEITDDRSFYEEAVEQPDGESQVGNLLKNPVCTEARKG